MNAPVMIIWPSQAAVRRAIGEAAERSDVDAWDVVYAWRSDTAAFVPAGHNTVMWFPVARNVTLDRPFEVLASELWELIESVRNR